MQRRYPRNPDAQRGHAPIHLVRQGLHRLLHMTEDRGLVILRTDDDVDLREPRLVDDDALMFDTSVFDCYQHRALGAALADIAALQIARKDD